MPRHIRQLDRPLSLHLTPKMRSAFAAMMSGEVFDPRDLGVPPATSARAGWEDQGWIGLDEVFGKPLYERQGHVAIVPVMGAVMDLRFSLWELFTDTLSVQTMKAACAEVAADTQVSTVIFDMDCPGGLASGGFELASAIRRVKDAGKRIVAVANPMICSLAWFVAAEADEIVAAPGSVSGSIGTLMIVNDTSRMAEEIGIKPNVVASDARKALGYFGVPVTEAMLADYEQWKNDHYGKFAAFVAEARGISEEQVREIGAAIMGADDLVASGLADRVAMMDEVIEEELREKKSENQPRGMGARGRSAVSVSSVHSVVNKEDIMSKLTIEAIKADPAWNDVLALAKNEVRGPLEAEIRGQVAAEATAKASEPAAFDALLAEFGGDDEGKVFAANAYAAKMPMSKARGEFNKARDAKLAKAQADLAEAQAKLASLSPGENPVATAPGGGGGQFKDYDTALLHFQSAAGGSMERVDAIAHVNKNFPGLREAMVRG